MKKKTKSERKDIRINIRVPLDEKNSLQALSRHLNVSSTMIVREAVKQKINELNAKIRESEVGEVITI